MNAKDLCASLHVRHIHLHLPVEAAWTKQRRIQNISAVGGRDDDDARVALKTIHLGKKLVQRLLTLVISAAHARTARASNSINLIHKDQTGGVLLRLLEQIAHSGRTNTNKHLHKLGARDGEERHTSLTSDGLGKQGLTSTRRANQQAALRNTSTNRGEALRTLQELNNLHEILLGLFNAGNISEGHTSVRLHLEFGLGLAKGHWVSRAAWAAHAPLTAARQEEEATNQQQWESQVAKKVQEHSTTIFSVGVRSKVDLLLPELVQELWAGSRQLDPHTLHTVAQLRRDGLHNSNGAILIQVDLLDAAHVEVFQEARV
mmetsp:Transcript_32806/g.97767  ORF Transcript_32806/g.97767 Transcript_32806/m.97767 type:complete len:317 (-) Transcript_32806:386-1336(-)